jgi:hypothetical protein
LPLSAAATRAAESTASMTAMMDRTTNETEKHDENHSALLRQSWVWASLGLVGVVLVSVLVAQVAMNDMGGGTINSTKTTTTNTATLSPCFEDYPIRTNMEIEEDLLGTLNPHCDNASHRPPCPAGGHCAGGTLKLCYDHFLHVSDDACVLTDASQRQLEALVDVLERYTVQHECHTGHRSRSGSHRSRGKNPFFAQESSGMGDDRRSVPLFYYKSLTDVLDIPHNPELLVYTTNAENTSNNTNHMFLIEDHPDGSLLVGLHPLRPIPLPLGCFMKKISLRLFSTVFAWTWTFVIVIGSWILSFYTDSPVVAVCATVLVLAVLSVSRTARRERHARQALVAEVVQFRERVYEELVRDHGRPPVPAQVLCDRIAWHAYPRSRRQREYMHRQLFPFVVRDLESDSRVVKSWTAGSTGSSQPELHWQWVDSQPHRATTATASSANNNTTTSNAKKVK